ncbi:hypothetical protein [Sphingomonas sanguinis]|jgi:hypothetical protein|uniref:Uncharacterized protein n=1 Tax=Sphingomonas sanguinis TaxID=33051 RepID=A0A7Y7UT80_9SPHN|nr:hypothetical protein [Sphingomonas sanguinis]MBZ6383241.1 hypothetical protein [Sphingomonas sanguinis]NNG49905.1 hypothetical protein [Sphingomonas sanguinis]NNG53758.1 hypothetical protein [Sphingomonas sanguinis]NVP32536.1 hypothetical protein [Sphingomonas sanguinis]HJO64656.1 hypothetical protein [Sphingomonas sanguinis]
MVPLLLLLVAPASDGEQGLTLPRLTPACTLSTCHGGKRPSPYRLAPDHGVAVDSKARAFANNGTYCAVVGDKYCTSKPRTLFRTAID